MQFDRLKRRDFIALLGRTAIVWPFSAQLATATENVMDNQIATWMEKQHVPGLAACIVKRDEVVWSSGYGMANLTERIPFTPDQCLFQIASITKVITATAIMQLRDKGLLKLDEDVNNFLEFSVRNPKYPDKPITFRHLLTHTSSINDSDAIYSVYAVGDPSLSLEEVVTKYFTSKEAPWGRQNYSRNRPGISKGYSNVGFALLGYLVEVISKQPLEEHLQQNVFRPLKMNETSFYISKLNREKHARPYTYLRKTAQQLVPGYGDGNLLPEGVSPKVGYNEHALYSYPTLADGMVRTSVKQLANFMVAMMNGGRFDETRLLSEETVNEMLAQKGQGLGWFKTGDYWGHDGGDPGCSTEMMFNPTNKVGFIIFANADVDLKQAKGLLLSKAEMKTH
jgi:CubicO group peptidase (beta-lactamase class C family)